MTAAGLVAYLVDARLFALGLSPWVTSPLVFVATYLAGRVLQPAALEPGQPFFLEDFIRDLVVYVLLGVLAAGAIWTARGVIGGQARPWLPAFGSFVFFTSYRRGR